MAETNKTTSVAKDVAKGTAWYVAMRWGIRGLGFVSSAFLARLLMPEDFGLVAIVLVLSGLVEILLEFGVNTALIQNNKAEDSHFHTAWTIRIMQTTAVAVCLSLAAPFIANYYEDPRIEIIAWVVATGIFVGGFQNIWIVKFQKDLNFFQDFLFNLIAKALSITVTIGLAFYFRSYMALVLGSLFSSFIGVVLSYVVIKHRPRFSLEKFSDIWGFSQWILIRNVAQYFSREGDKFILAALVSPTQMGFYKWGTELSSMTITEIQQPFSRALLPGLAKIKDDKERLNSAYLSALNIMTFVAVPVALGFGAISNELIPIFLGGGDKWLPVVPLIEALVFYAMLVSMYGISGSLLLISGNVKYTAYMFWIQAIIILMSIYPAYLYYDLEGVAYSRAIIGIIMFFVVSLMVVQCCNVKMSGILSAIWRPVVAGLIMFFVLIEFVNLPTYSDVVILALKVLVGGGVYSVTIMLLWLLSGKPDSAEAKTLMQMRARLPF